MQSNDLLVKLYNLNRDTAFLEALEGKGIRIVRAIAPDMHLVLSFVRENFSEGWVSECQAAMLRNTCHIAIKDKAVVGFACCEATAKGFFGPTGVRKDMRGLGIGKALLIESLLLLRELGYGYGIIGGSSDATPFYQKTAGAIIIEDSSPGIYRAMIHVN